MSVSGAPAERSGAILARWDAPKPAKFAPQTAELAAKICSEAALGMPPEHQNRSGTLPNAPRLIF